MKKVNSYFFLIFFLCVFFFFSADLGAKEIARQLDCNKNAACIETYKKEKEIWIYCLEEAGLSDKKLQRLSLKVERLGIRNLKKQEFFIFDSKRKACHKIFKKSISIISLDSNSEDLKKFPSILDDLNKRLP